MIDQADARCRSLDCDLVHVSKSWEARTMGSIITKYYDNALTAPSRGFKCWITEGGIRCPCLVRYPLHRAS
ncbi:hypothetical protein VE00_10600 [Pseudogymnoascus sp. WSF 3629]|nr:hypothetical protein VE00_10600 [Pseudogymnoascus sp. WSF 3629]